MLSTLPCERLLSFLQSQRVPFRVLQHPECRSADESTAARSAAGAPESVGAKALLIKLASGDFAVLALPAPLRLDSKALRRRLGTFRFATDAELYQTMGLQYGMVPPFGKPVFARVGRLFVDQALLEAPTIGFNVASLTTSVVMVCRDYLAICGADDIFPFTAASAGSLCGANHN
jgi:prolyl-tRNA editing enzyme YbaK/EbsC (Cys-tRNA(Pro) deacylase)